MLMAYPPSSITYFKAFIAAHYASIFGWHRKSYEDQQRSLIEPLGKTFGFLFQRLGRARLRGR